MRPKYTRRVEDALLEFALKPATWPWLHSLLSWLLPRGVRSIFAHQARVTSGTNTAHHPSVYPASHFCSVIRCLATVRGTGHAHGLPNVTAHNRESVGRRKAVLVEERLDAGQNRSQSMADYALSPSARIHSST